MGQENKNMMKWEETNDGNAVVERINVDDDNGEHDLIAVTTTTISHTSWSFSFVFNSQMHVFLL